MAADRYRFGALNDLYCQPLMYLLERTPACAGVLFDSSSAQCERLMLNEIDAALISPLDYGFNSSDFKIYPSFCVSSEKTSRTIHLYLKHKSSSIQTLAVNTASSSEIVLAKIILGEKYESNPAIVPVLGDLHTMLAKADAALVAGDALFNTQYDGPYLDVVDEWCDLTELPFVHCLCVGREDRFHQQLNLTLASLQSELELSIETLADERSTRHGVAPDFLSEYFSRFSFTFDEAERSALDEYFRFAYYRGMLGDVPEIRVFP